MLALVCGALTAAAVCEMHLPLKGATLLPFNFCAFVLLSVLRMLSVRFCVVFFFCFFNILAAKLLRLGQKLVCKTQHESHEQIPASTMPSYRKQLYKRGGWMLVTNSTFSFALAKKHVCSFAAFLIFFSTVIINISTHLYWLLSITPVNSQQPRAALF